MEIKTQSIRYAGSKHKLLKNIIRMTKKTKSKKILDGFSGSTRVSQAYKQFDYLVHSNDLAPYSKVLAECFLLNKKPKDYFDKIIEHLNSLSPVFGWFSENYGGEENNGLSIQRDGLKKPFQIHNTMKLDAIRNEIDNLDLSEIDKSVLITSLLLGLDKVQNDLGHQVSYLKQWSKKSYNDLFLEVPDYFVDSKIHKVFNTDIFNITEEYDLIYLDPPYGTNNKKTPTSRVRYFSYYHLWTTIVKNDKPLLFGASKRREDVSSDRKKGAISIFEDLDENKVLEGFENLLKLNTKYFLFSYNNRSKISIEKLIELFENKTKVISIESYSHLENSQGNSLITGKYKQKHDEENKEFLFLLEKT